ncbi:uracil-DNA glycosylase, putative [Bodo saltans]|uniref:Uracil-DNA glycosylase n=1 Tax=Bodo saltans TaxID=75058 RepID=A0A0S4JHG4_BODSA|nr:uracil-DNA glycosylase, putative [Bodo saltans]|eukprot:CUG88446.1 uracil-DNA glycosylase, putative [Bodo saltans]
MAPKAAKAQATLTSFAKGQKVLDAPAPKRSRESALADGILDPEWKSFLAPLLASPAFENIESFLEKEYSEGKEVFPEKSNIFSAFNFTPLKDVKVVLIGQDPYHDNDQAHGLCFSVLPGVKVPPSLVNMYKELVTDIPGFVTPSHGYLESWARQGILMLNATLTVEAHKANSHAACGWQAFTDGVIKKLGTEKSDIVFLLWGGFAQKKAKLIDATKHKIVECAHPSPLSATKWWGCKTFSKCNDALIALGKPPVDWKLPFAPPSLK